MPIYDNVVHYAKRQGVSIRELESRAGIGNGVVRKWNHSVPSVVNIQKVAALLHVTVDDLLRDTHMDD